MFLSIVVWQNEDARSSSWTKMGTYSQRTGSLVDANCGETGRGTILALYHPFTSARYCLTRIIPSVLHVKKSWVQFLTVGYEAAVACMFDTTAEGRCQKTLSSDGKTRDVQDKMQSRAFRTKTPLGVASAKANFSSCQGVEVQSPDIFDNKGAGTRRGQCVLMRQGDQVLSNPRWHRSGVDRSAESDGDAAWRYEAPKRRESGKTPNLILDMQKTPGKSRRYGLPAATSRNRAGQK